MRRFCSGIAGVVLAFTIIGCGDSAPEGPLPTQSVSPDLIDKQLKIMSDNQKNRVFEKKQVDTQPAAAPAATKPDAK
jgi:hypothetical protein